MSNSVVAKRYAVALFQLGTEKSFSDQLEEELHAVLHVFKNEEKLKHFFENPRRSTQEKKQFIREVFKDLSTQTVNLLLVLMDKNRLNILPQIVSEFVAMKNKARGVAEADVYSVKALTEDEKNHVKDVFARKLNLNTLRINNIVDEDILGGLKVRIGNQIYDGTIKNKLTRIEQKVVTATK
ncbi:F0F1 ATP synthase subunit delta [Halalkalibacillus halophilus]|uniref:F0F1 ATP synthase subunit delta n=1 Tax=Halalkalibacillus halophilus TaxID=392827 RepID=UPI000409BC81|nr:F0F1 ATP synthase subunit delta [Halalkalibacillus halophilus]